MKYLVSIVAALSFAGYAVPALAQAANVAATTQYPRCDAPATVDEIPSLEMPDIAAGQGAGGTAQVKIELTAQGNLANAEIFSSSGNRWLDREALLSARMARFTAESVNCRHVAGSYLYEVQF